MDVLSAASLSSRRPDLRGRGLAVAIGNFDGVHLGHRQIFEACRSRAGAAGVPSAVLTFDPHPARVLSPDLAPPLIVSPARKLELIAEAGIEVAIVEPFTRELASRAPDDFAQHILVDALGAREVAVGYDFTFGRQRSGTTAVLAELGERLGFGVTIVPQFSRDGIVCSSTKIREFLMEGRVEGAALLLGRPPELTGTVVVGKGRGRTIGVPTANVAVEAELLPRAGVYAALAFPDADRSRPGRAAVVNVGTAPTFNPGSQALTVEAHLLDTSEDLYGRRLALDLAARLREERRFPSVEALTTQIAADIQEARARLAADPARSGR